MQSKPFNLQKALDGEAVVTTQGLDVLQLVRFNDTVNGTPIRAVVDGRIRAYRLDGTQAEGVNIDGTPTSRTGDLRMKVRLTTKWINIYVGLGIGNPTQGLTKLFVTEKLADLAHARRYTSSAVQRLGGRAIEITYER